MLEHALPATLSIPPGSTATPTLWPPAVIPTSTISTEPTALSAVMQMLSPSTALPQPFTRPAPQVPTLVDPTSALPATLLLPIGSPAPPTPLPQAAHLDLI